ncbi:arsinothricin resistance N-acetyltransferase ArsN1 family B [Longibacter sp.]|jgi:phosphinothricin acetyltransferase|uniref:arsinothricin resistance N-acetyltransferase ArsN1 family B n=1 Tax=Longibacter sp. TaxID=2045415 RepID=UPI003EBCBF7D
MIRPVEQEDAGDVAAIYRPIVEETPISFEAEAPSPDAMRSRMLDTAKDRPWLVCDLGDQIAGYAYATPHRSRGAYRWSVDSSIYVGKAFRRRGVARALYTALFGVLRAQGYVNVFAGVTLPNPASVALHESMGFQPVGVYRRVGYKQGAWHDVGWWQRALQDVQAPGEIVAFDEMSSRPLVRDALQSGWERLDTA